MTKKEHIAHHKLLHAILDELLADYLMNHHGKYLSEILIMDVMRWSSEQCENPTEPFYIKKIAISK